MNKPKGYIASHDRKICEDCKFFDSNWGKVPSQLVVTKCTKVEPPMEVYYEDICDEYEENEK